MDRKIEFPPAEYPEHRLVQLKLVLDTNVVIDWLVFDEPFMNPLRFAVRDGRVEILTHPGAVEELRRVLGYPALKLGATEQLDVFRRYQAQTSLVDSKQVTQAAPLPKGFPRCRDADDNPFAGAGLSSRRDCAGIARQRPRNSTCPSTGGLHGRSARIRSPIGQGEELMKARIVCLLISLFAACALASGAPAMARSPEDTVRDYVRYWNSGDLRGFLALYAPDARMFRHDDNVDTLETAGQEQLRRRFIKVFARDRRQVRVEILTVTTVGEFVVSRERVTGLPGGRVAQEISVYQVRDGLIRTVWNLGRRVI